MKITSKLLEEKDACYPAIKEFNELNLEGIDVYDLIEILHDRKDHKNYSEWLFEELKLTGECIGYYDNGEVMYIRNYKNGKLHGECVGYYDNGKVWYIYNYKHGKRHGEFIYYYKNSVLVWEE